MWFDGNVRTGLFEQRCYMVLQVVVSKDRVSTMLAAETVVHSELFSVNTGRKMRRLPAIPKTQGVPESRLVEVEVLILYEDDIIVM